MKIERWIMATLALTLAAPTIARTAASTATDRPASAAADQATTTALPINVQALEGYQENTTRGCRNLFSIDQLQAAVSGGSNALTFDLSGVTTLLDGTGAPDYTPAKVYGTVYMGPYPFEDVETHYAYKRFRTSASVTGGRATLDVGYLMSGNHNSEGWTDTGQVAVRFDLMLETPGADRRLGVYDTFVRFRKTTAGFEKLPSLLEGPFVCLVRSDEPGQVVISARISQPAAVAVQLDDGRTFSGTPGQTRHEITVGGLQPDTSYTYTLLIDGMAAARQTFRTAPRPGPAGRPVRFAYCGDSREAAGGGGNAFMGHNADIFERLMSQAFAARAEFFIMGGDLVSGYTAVKADFAAQLQAWKQSAAGFWRERPIYPTLGNHESLLRVFTKGSERVSLDRWPYDTDSAEAVFAAEFVNPANAPIPADPRRPTYTENVYSFQYGPVMVIAFNNNYWVSYNSESFGGCPEGYLMGDQLNWIKSELKRADEDDSVKFVVLFAQEPVFPNGGHTGDAMWYGGSNRKRAYVFDAASEQLKPEVKGILEVRDELLRAVAACTKAAAVLGSDEHGYHKTLITNTVPIGNIARDDKNNDGRIGGDGEQPTPLDDLARPVWYMVCGGGGAPYYSHDDTPWNQYWLAQDPPDAPAPQRRYYYSSQANFFLFEADADRIGVRVLNPQGEEIDRIDDLMAVKAPGSGLAVK
ncbi:MAG: hypothetical protein Kow0059_15550 [Candidatus Sumerlaeia bacterium]